MWSVCLCLRRRVGSGYALVWRESQPRKVASSYFSYKQLSDDLTQGLDVNARRCQEHVDMMLFQFVKHDGEIMRKTCSEAEHLDKQQLLFELSELIDVCLVVSPSTRPFS